MDLDLFIEGLDSRQKRNFEVLHNMFLDFPGVRLTMRYKIPFYDYTSWICYINPIKNEKAGLELCFINGKILNTYGHNLEPKKRKQIAGITIHDLDESLLNYITEVFTEAIVLDDSLSKNKN